jgi:hypothetical protein
MTHEASCGTHWPHRRRVLAVEVFSSGGSVRFAGPWVRVAGSHRRLERLDAGHGNRPDRQAPQCGKESAREDARAEVLALGPTVIPRLVDLLDEDEDGWAAIHAVDLLVDLKAVDAVGPMLQVLDEVDLDDELSNRIAIRLPELGSPVLEPALELLSNSEDEDTTLGVCEVLAKLGVRDDRVFDALRTLFEDSEMLGAGLLADYGDERGLPLVDRALTDFEPDFTTMWG